MTDQNVINDFIDMLDNAIEKKQANPTAQSLEMPDASTLVDLLDSLMQKGSGHVSVTADDLQEGLNVHTVNAKTCAGSACMQPTELSTDDE